MSKTYAQLAREIAALQASAQRQLAMESKVAVARINEMIAQYQLTAGDLKFASSSAATPPSSKRTKSVKPKAAAGMRSRYSDGQGNVWGGRGPRPRWLRSALAAGRALESFLTGAAPAPAAAPAVPTAQAAPSAGKAAAKKVAPKKTAAKKVVPKGVSAVAKAPASTKAIKEASTTPTAKKSQAIGRDKKAASEAAVKKASTAKPAAKKAPAKKAKGVKRSVGAKPAGKVATKKAAVSKKSAIGVTSPAAKLPAASTSTTAMPTPATAAATS